MLSSLIALIAIALEWGRKMIFRMLRFLFSLEKTMRFRKERKIARQIGIQDEGPASVSTIIDGLPVEKSECPMCRKNYLRGGRAINNNPPYQILWCSNCRTQVDQDAVFSKDYFSKPAAL